MSVARGCLGSPCSQRVAGARTAPGAVKGCLPASTRRLAAGRLSAPLPDRLSHSGQARLCIRARFRFQCHKGCLCISAARCCSRARAILHPRGRCWTARAAFGPLSSTRGESSPPMALSSLRLSVSPSRENGMLTRQGPGELPASLPLRRAAECLSRPGEWTAPPQHAVQGKGSIQDRFRRELLTKNGRVDLTFKSTTIHFRLPEVLPRPCPQGISWSCLNPQKLLLEYFPKIITIPPLYVHISPGGRNTIKLIPQPASLCLLVALCTVSRSQ